MSQNREHAGGPPSVALDYGRPGDQPVPEASEEFPYHLLDHAVDEICEAVMQGRRPDAMNILFSWASTHSEDRFVEGLKWGLCRVLAGNDAKQTAIFLAVATGLHLTLGRSMADLAREACVTKQALQKGVENLRIRLDMPRAANMRSDEAREKMRKNNYRPTKK